MASDRIFLYVQAMDPISAAGISAALSNRAEVRVVGVHQITPRTVGLIVVDTMDEEATGLVRSMRSKGLRHVVAVVSEMDDPGLMAAIESGVSGVVRRREATPDQLVQVVTSVHRGAGVVPPDLLGRLLKRVSQVEERKPTSRAPGATGLTEREEEVLKLVAEGLDTREIATRLAYSERTVKNVLHDITHRFHLRNRSHAVAYTIREGLI
ncbi:response regulator transcription factor [Streptomyces sp. NBC_01471]|uniref:helix-turn-helix transcriptional regulator n=1 Tax=Streptomyces sp. NBC_01471 TaxID=2903879 RepID=UPI003244C176